MRPVVNERFEAMKERLDDLRLWISFGDDSVEIAAGRCRVKLAIGDLGWILCAVYDGLIGRNDGPEAWIR